MVLLGIWADLGALFLVVFAFFAFTGDNLGLTITGPLFHLS